MSSASFTRLATVEAITKRNPAKSGGKVGAPVEHLTGLKILPLMPVSKEIQEKYQLKSPRLSFVTYIQDVTDILHGDVLVVDSVDYNIIASSPWVGIWECLELVVEKVAGS
jgi:hypothetical protein